MVIYDRFDVLVIDFPFSDMDLSKRRPALILSDAEFIRQSGNALVSMITSAKHSDWPGDCEISDMLAAGLPSPSKVRMRFWTIAYNRMEGPIGHLREADQISVRAALRQTLAL